MMHQIDIPKVSVTRQKFSQLLKNEVFLSQDDLMFIKVDGQFGRQMSTGPAFANLRPFKNSDMVHLPPFTSQANLHAISVQIFAE